MKPLGNKNVNSIKKKETEVESSCKEITFKFEEREECLDLKHPLNNYSELIKYLLSREDEDEDEDDDDIDKVIPLKSINKEIFKLCKDYCELLEKNEEVRNDIIPTPIKDNNLENINKEKLLFLKNYNLLNNKETLFNVLETSNYLDIKSLNELCCAAIASIVPKDPNGFLEYFGLENDLKLEKDNLDRKMTVEEKDSVGVIEEKVGGS